MERNDIFDAYLNSLALLKGIEKGVNAVLLQFLNITIKQDNKLRLYLNRSIKEDIAAKCNISRSRVEQIITRLVKFDYMKRIEASTFEFNEKLFGCINWKDVTEINRISFTVNLSHDGVEICSTLDPVYERMVSHESTDSKNI